MAKKRKSKRARPDYQPMKGWYAMYRNWPDHPIFDDEPFTQREAWEWLIATAIFSPAGYLVKINGIEYRLRRGQLSYSLRFMAQNWGWDDSRVDRFLEKLQKNYMIETNTETGQNIITICNYDKYQGVIKVSEAGVESISSKQRDKGETNNKKYKKEKNVLTGSYTKRTRTSDTLPVKKPKEQWKKVLYEQFGDGVFKSWFDDLVFENGHVIFPNPFKKDKCTQRYSQEIAVAIEHSGMEFKGFKTRAERMY